VVYVDNSVSIEKEGFFHLLSNRNILRELYPFPLKSAQTTPLPNLDKEREHIPDSINDAWKREIEHYLYHDVIIRVIEEMERSAFIEME